MGEEVVLVGADALLLTNAVNEARMEVMLVCKERYSGRQSRPRMEGEGGRTGRISREGGGEEKKRKNVNV